MVTMSSMFCATTSTSAGVAARTAGPPSGRARTEASRRDRRCRIDSSPLRCRAGSRPARLRVARDGRLFPFKQTALYSQGRIARLRPGFFAGCRVQDDRESGAWPSSRTSPCPASCAHRGARDARWSGRGGFVVVVALTFLGLLAITFFIGRIVPIDPVLAVVGDRATKEVYENAPHRHGPRPPADRAVRQLRGRRPDRQPRHVGLHRPPGGRGPRARLPGDAGDGDARHPDRRAPRRAHGADRRQPAGDLDRPGHPRRRPARLLGAGVLAGAGRAPALLRPARLGGGTGPHRHLLRRAGAAGHRAAARRQPDRRRPGHLRQRRQPPDPAGVDPRLLQPRLYRAHDPLVHARPARRRSSSPPRG